MHFCFHLLIIINKKSVIIHNFFYWILCIILYFEFILFLYYLLFFVCIIIITLLNRMQWWSIIFIFLCTCPSCRQAKRLAERTDSKPTNSGTTAQDSKDSKAVVQELNPPLRPVPPKAPTTAAASFYTCQHAIWWMCPMI